MLIMFNICSEVEWKSDGVQAANAELFQLKAIRSLSLTVHALLTREGREEARNGGSRQVGISWIMRRSPFKATCYHCVLLKRARSEVAGLEPASRKEEN